MRNLLLAVFMVSFTMSAFGQDQVHYYVPMSQRLYSQDPISTGSAPLKNNNSSVFKNGKQSNSTRYTRCVKIGSSANIFTALLSQQHCFGYKKVGSNDVFYLVHRQCNSFVNSSDAASSGYIEMDASIDHGKTWDSAMRRVFVKTGDAAKRPRYPSGDLFVYNSDTSWKHAFAAATGPVTNGTNWIANYGGISRMDTTIKSYRIMNTSGVDVSFPRLSTTATPNHVWGLGFLENVIDTHNSRLSGIGLIKGTYVPSGDSMTYSITKIMVPSKTYLSSGGHVNYYVNTANMAWSADGKTGYIVYVNVDSAGKGNDHYRFHIWKTTDEGATWTASLFDPTDTANHFCHLTDSLHALKSNAAKTYVMPLNDNDLVVDGNGNLHIVTGMGSAASNSSDSLTWYYNPTGGKPFLIDFFQNSKGGWSYFTFGKVNTAEVTASTTGNTYIDGSGSKMSWGTRIQASCEPTTNKIFYSWMDSDPTVNTDNLAPDVYVAALDLKNNKYKPATNKTGDNNLFPSQIYWYFAAKNILRTTNGSVTTYTIPASFSEPFDPTNLDGGAPHNHWFLSGLNITEDSFTNDAHGMIFSNCLTSTSEINNNAGITHVYPNPVSNKCIVEFNAINANKVTVQVNNLLGQSVYSQVVNPYTGSNKLTIDMASYAPGVYLISVNNGSVVSTFKLVKN